jgi:hypothetical protein
MRNALILVVLLILGGCSSTKIHELDPKWRPLEDVRERPNLVRDVGSKTALTTIGDHIYVRDLQDFLTRYVPGSAKYHAAMRHEQEHSIRQNARGVVTWIVQYSYDKEFALLEEQIGYYYEIKERRRLGDPINVNGTAVVLSRYKNLSGKLISFDDAKKWILDVLAGKWTPPA